MKLSDIVSYLTDLDIEGEYKLREFRMESIDVEVNILELLSQNCYKVRKPIKIITIELEETKNISDSKN